MSRYLPIKMKCKKAYRMPEGNALCLDGSNGELSIYTEKGKLVKRISGVNNPVAAVDANRITIVDGDRIKVFDHEGIAVLEGNGFGGNGMGEGKLDSPQSVFTRHNKIFIADTGNQRIQLFSDDGVFLDKIENPRPEELKIIERPVSVVVDAQGNIFVADQGNEKLHVFDKHRKHLYSLGGEDDRRASFRRMYDLAIDADNNLYVLCREENNDYSIQVYNGPKKIISFLAEFELDVGLEEPENLTVSMNNRSLVGVYDREKNKLMSFSYQQIPQQVGELRVAGGVEKTVISWSAVPGKFIKGYNIYGAQSEQSEFKFVTQVYDSSASIKHENGLVITHGAMGQGQDSSKLFAQFIKAYPEHPLVADAKALLAEM